MKRVSTRLDSRGIGVWHAIDRGETLGSCLEDWQETRIDDDVWLQACADIHQAPVLKCQQSALCQHENNGHQCKG
jgi:hypothetical protein